MVYKAKDITTRLVRKELNKYNREINKLKKLGKGYEVLEPIELKDIIGGSNVKIARQLNRLSKIYQEDERKLVPYKKGSSVKVPKFFRDNLEEQIKEANKMLEKRIKESPTLKEQGYKPLTLGGGQSIKEIKSRAETIKNRSNERWYSEADERFKENYIKSLRDNLGPYAEPIIKRISGLSGREIYEMSLDMYEGPTIMIEYNYGPDFPQEKFEVINEALDYFGV